MAHLVRIVPEGDVLLRLEQQRRLPPAATTVTHQDAAPDTDTTPSSPTTTAATVVEDSDSLGAATAAGTMVTETVELQVASSTLRLVSPVFAALLDEAFQQQQASLEEPPQEPLAQASKVPMQTPPEATLLPQEPPRLAPKEPLAQVLQALAQAQTPPVGPASPTSSKKKKKKGSGGGAAPVGPSAAALAAAPVSALPGAGTSPAAGESRRSSCSELLLGQRPPLPSTTPMVPRAPDAGRTAAAMTPAAVATPRVLVLPDDAPAMTLLMRLVHFRLGDLYDPAGDGVHGGLPGPSLLARLATVCDKYACAGALQGASELWVRENMERDDRAGPDGEDRGKDGHGHEDREHAGQTTVDRIAPLLVFSCVADQPRVFADLCWRLVVHGAGLGSAPLHAALARYPLLPPGLAVHLADRRAASEARLQAALTAPLRLGWTTLGDRHGRAIGARAVGAYMQMLLAAGLLDASVPGALAATAPSLATRLAAVDQLPPLWTHDVYPTGYDGADGDPDVDLTAAVRAAQAAILGGRDGSTCLDCVRSNGRAGTDTQGRCRVRHAAARCHGVGGV